MDFNLTEEHLMIQQAAKDFAQNELMPGVIERDEHSKFPTEQVKMMADLGFMGMMVDPKYGGSGLDSISYVLALTEIAKVDASSAVIMSVNNSLVCAGLEKYCTEEQKMKYLVPLAKGEVIGAFCLSEPEAGSDATSQKTTALDKGDHYLLNGTKNWITNGSSASTYIVIAQTDLDKGHKGINAFIVEKGWAGFEIGPKEKKMGIRGSDTHSLMFTDVKIPKENRIGADGFGFRPCPERGLVKIPQIGNVIIGNGVEIGANSCVDRGKFSSTVLGDGCKIDNLVQIGHNSKLGRFCIMAGNSGLAGSVTLGDGVIIGGSASIKDHTTIGSGAVVGAGSGVVGDVEAGKTMLGYPAVEARMALKQWAMLKRLVTESEKK